MVGPEGYTLVDEGENNIFTTLPTVAMRRVREGHTPTNTLIVSFDPQTGIEYSYTQSLDKRITQ